MFTKEIPLFKLFGFEVKLDLSWIILAVLITWSLAVGVFPSLFPDISTVGYWAMAVVGAFGFFFSIVFHEFSHSFVARQYGIPMKGITLFIFGGIAQMSSEPPNPKSELLMAIAGPIASIVLGLGFYGFAALLTNIGFSVAFAGLFSYLGIINIILAVFNMVPAFPLDGGRVLRAVLWHFKGNLRSATRISSNLGSGFGFILMALGVLAFIGGEFLSGVWWFLIGMFIGQASKASFQQLLVRETLEGEPVSKFMNTEPKVVPGDTSVSEFVDQYVYKTHHKLYPVTKNGEVTGCIHLQNVKSLDRDTWGDHTVDDIMEQCSDDNTIAPNVDAMKALSIMNRTGNSRLLVMDGKNLVGLLALKDLLEFLSLKMDLESDTQGLLLQSGIGNRALEQAPTTGNGDQKSSPKDLVSSSPDHGDRDLDERDKKK